MPIETFNYELLRPRLEMYAPEIARRMDAILERSNIHIDNLQSQSDLRVNILAPHMNFSDLCEMRRYYSANEDPFREEVLRRISQFESLFGARENASISIQAIYDTISNTQYNIQQKHQQLQQLGLNITSQNAEDYITYLSFYFQKYPILANVRTIGEYLPGQQISGLPASEQILNAFDGHAEFYALARVISTATSMNVRFDPTTGIRNLYIQRNSTNHIIPINDILHQIERDMRANNFHALKGNYDEMRRILTTTNLTATTNQVAFRNVASAYSRDYLTHYDTMRSIARLRTGGGNATTEILPGGRVVVPSTISEIERQISAEKARLTPLSTDMTLSSESRTFVQERLNSINAIEAEITTVRSGGRRAELYRQYDGFRRENALPITKETVDIVRKQMTVESVIRNIDQHTADFHTQVTDIELQVTDGRLNKTQATTLIEREGERVNTLLATEQDRLTGLGMTDEELRIIKNNIPETPTKTGIFKRLEQFANHKYTRRAGVLGAGMMMIALYKNHESIDKNDLADIGIGMIPILGGAWDIFQGCRGKDCISGREIDATERAMRIGFGLVGLVPGAGWLVKGLGTGARVASRAGRVGKAVAGGMNHVAMNLPRGARTLHSLGAIATLPVLGITAKSIFIDS